MIPIMKSNSSEPLYMQIYNQLKSAITQNTIPANTRLLSKRKMASQLGVSVNTVNTAYSQLVSEGFITVRAQSGYYVCELEPLYVQRKNGIKLPAKNNPTGNDETLTNMIDFSIDGVDSYSFPYSVWKKLMKYSFNEYNPQLLQCSKPQGESALRQAIAANLYLSRGVRCDAEQIIIGAGTENLLQILSIIIDDSCTVAMENPVYHRAYGFFQATGHRIYAVDTDSHGAVPENLTSLSSAVLYVTPSHQFPLGITMPISRRIKLLNWASERENRFIIEDDYNSEFRYSSRPVPALKSIDTSSRVIYLGSFARSIAPSLRISYMVLPEELMLKYNQSTPLFSCAASKLDQLTLTQFIEKGHYETHLNKMRKLYKEKREYFVSAIYRAFGKTISIGGENAGHHLLLHVHDSQSESCLCRKAMQAGAKVYPISPYFSGPLPKAYQSTVLAGYATLSLADIQKGTELLYIAWTK